ESVSVAAADFNGDGKPDLVVVNRLDSTLSLLVNITTTAASTATFAKQQTLATGMFALAAAVADVNGDGKPDLTVTYGSFGGTTYDTSVSVFFDVTPTAATSLTFTNQQNLASIKSSRAVAVADINGDGKPDLLLAHGELLPVNADNMLSLRLSTPA